MSLADQLQARAAQRAESRPLWLQADHAETVTMSVGEAELNQTVSSIVVHAAQANMGNTNSAHFRIFLQLSNNTSVKLDSFGLQQLKTKLTISYHNYPFSKTRSLMNVHSVSVKKSFTVLDAVTTLLTNNRDRYRLDTDSGSGCRHWCHVVIADFINKGWVDQKSANAVEELTAVLKADEKFRDVYIPIPAPQGTFF